MGYSAKSCKASKIGYCKSTAYDRMLKGLVGSDHDVTLRPTSVDDNPELVKPPDDTQYFLADLMTSTNPLFVGTSELVLDSMPLNLTMRDRFVGFTGDFQEFTRKTCFEEVQKLGGVPSDPDMFLDYLFVSEKRIISNQLFAAIYYRRVYGNPLILREADWIKVVSASRS